MNQMNLPEGERLNSRAVLVKSGLTVFFQLRGPHSIWDTGQIGRYDLLSFQPMSENTEGAPRTAATDGENLRTVRIWKQVEHPRIQDWIKRCHLVN